MTTAISDKQYSNERLHLFQRQDKLLAALEVLDG
jgi:hypothetical protein